MRNACLWRDTILILAATLPALAHAQFQPPTSEELKMTADPKAPGAAAVYLDIQEIANDPLHYQSYSARIKVLTEKGKELATVSLPYLKGGWKITDIKGRTIHADGTVIPLSGKPEDLLSEKSKDKQFGRKVFTLPNVEVGSILEYSYDIRYDDNEFTSPTWEIQRPYFVHKAHYQFTPFKAFMPTGTPGTDTNMYLMDQRGRLVSSLLWWSYLPTGVSVKTSIGGSYSVDVTDVPPIPDEEYMPPIRSILYKLDFYYSFAHDAMNFWTSEAKFWSKDVDKFAEPSKPLKEAVAGIVAANDSELDKAKKIYAAVQALDNTDYSRKKNQSEMKALNLKEAKHAEDTWAQKSGSSEDIALLYLAMLRAAGLSARAIKIVDRDKGVFDPSYMTLSQLDTTLVAVTAGGNDTLTDPGEKMCPFGTLNWRHSNARGLGQNAKEVAIASTPAQQYKDNAVTRNGNLTLDARGAVSGQVTIVMSGQEALRWRQEALRNDETELKKQFDHSELEGIVPDGIEAHVDHFLGLDKPEANLLAIVKVSGTLGTATAKRLLLPGFFFATRGREPFVDEEKRIVPVDMHYASRVTDSITYQLPEGLAVEGAPADANISWAGHAMLIIKSKSSPGQITIANSLARAFTEAKPEEYQDLRGFYQKVAAAEQGQLVLTAATATAAAASPTTPQTKSN
jgi:transglutaminase-like putative cysteine protease